MMGDTGRSPSGRATHERSRVAPSPPTVSVPNALEQIDYLVDALERIAMHAKLLPAKGRPPRILFQSAIACAEDNLRLWRTVYPDTAQAVEAYNDYWADGGAWERDLAAQAIEAQRAETAKTGSVEDESAVGNADVPKGCGPKEVV